MELYKSFCGKRERGPFTPSEAVAYAVDSVHADGEIERLRERVENLTGIVGRLVEELKTLRSDQIVNILGHGYEAED